MDQPTVPEIPRKPSRSLRRPLSLLAMAIVAGGLVFGLSYLGSATPDEAAAPDAVASESTTPPVTAVPGSESPAEPVASTPPETVRPELSNDIVRSTQVAGAFADQIDRPGSTYGIAYSTESGVVVLDAEGISEPDVEIAQRFDHASQFAMLTGDGSTWAVDAADRSRSYLISNMYVVVEAERSGTIAVIDEENRTIGLLSAGLPIPSIEVPTDAELIAVQGRGVLVLPADGGTLELSGIASSLVQLSEAHAVSASTSATVYEECEGGPVCSYVVVTQDPAASYPVVISSDSLVDVSPTGRWVLVRNDDENLLIHVESGAATELGRESISQVAWAPGDGFIALGRGGKIDVFLPDEARSVTLDTNETAALIALVAFVS